MNKLITTIAALVTLIPTVASARPNEGYRETGDVTMSARRGDIASRYVLREDGSLFRQIGRTLCQVTTNVDEIKIPQRADDSVAAYVVRDGELMALRPTRGAVPEGTCPRARLDSMVRALDRAEDMKFSYQLIDRTDTPITMIAWGADNRFTAWDARGVAVAVDDASWFYVNDCFGSRKQFGSYLAFIHTRDGRLIKIGGKDPRKSKTDARRYASFDSFLSTNHVCQ